MRLQKRFGLVLMSLVLMSGCTVANYVVDPYTNIHFEARETINPDASGRASPLVLRVYELNSEETFRSAGFFDLYDEPQGVLDKDLVSVKEVVIRPGLEQLLAMRLDENTRYLGIVAAFQNIEQAEWKLLFDAKPEGYRDIRIVIDAMDMERVRD